MSRSALAGVALLALAACATQRPPAVGVRAPGHEEGIASWYGPGFEGKATASGERFDSSDLTAAHPTLPFGTRVRVTLLANGKSVVVRINDRFGRHKDRAIDLSKAAAVRIGLIGPGTARVRLEVLPTAAD